MKIKEGFLLREIAGTHIVVPIGERVIDFKGMMVLNSVSADVWSFLSEHRSYEEILEYILGLYEVDRQTVENDLNDLIGQMEACGVIEV